LDVDAEIERTVAPHHWLGVDVLVPIKRFNETLVEMRRAEELDPLSLIIGTNLGDTFLYMRRYDEAIAQYKRSLSLEPNFQIAHFNLGWIFHAKGMYREAITEYRKGLDLSYDPVVNGYLALSLAKSGQRDEATKLLNQLKQESAERYVQNYTIAIAYIGLNEKEEAFVWLEKDVAEHSSNPVSMPLTRQAAFISLSLQRQGNKSADYWQRIKRAGNFERATCPTRKRYYALCRVD